MLCGLRLTAHICSHSCVTQQSLECWQRQQPHLRVPGLSKAGLCLVALVLSHTALTPAPLLPSPPLPTISRPTPRDPRSQHLSIQDCGVPHLPSSSCLQSLCAWRRWGGPLQVPRTPGSPANIPFLGLGGLWQASPEDGLRHRPPPRAGAWSEGSHLQAAEARASTPGVPAVSGQSPWSRTECLGRSRVPTGRPAVHWAARVSGT